MRGKRHLDGWLRNPDRFEVVAVCDLDRQKAKTVADEFGITPALYTDADTMLNETRPEVFCFSTQPDVRLPLVRLAAKYGVAGLVFEKPMATSIADAWGITRLCRESGIKAAVSHQQKYLTSFQKLKEIVDAGEIGETIRTDATCQPWLSHLGTHYIDYILWVNNGARAKWVVGHAHGRDLLTDSHPSPNYTMGQFALENGVRAYVEFGKLSASHMGPEKFWVDNRLTVHGTHGYVWCDTDGRWGALTRSSGGKVLAGAGDDWGAQECDRLQVLFARDFADWLDDDRRVHPCNIDISYHGFEIAEGLYISAMEHRRVDLPLDPQASGDIIARMLAELPACPEYSAKSE
jgi:predicted dehydrogenase